MPPADLYDQEFQTELGHRDIHVSALVVRSLAGLLSDGFPGPAHLSGPRAPEPVRLWSRAGFRRADHVADGKGTEQLPAAGQESSFPERKYYPPYLKSCKPPCQLFFC